MQQAHDDTHFDTRRVGAAGTVRRCACAAWLSLAALASPALAASIVSVTGTAQGGGEVVRIELSEPATALPTGFTTQAPARIALDFTGTTSTLEQPRVAVQQGNLSSIHVFEGQERTRVVLNLKSTTTYRVEAEDQAVLVFLDPVRPAVSVQQPVTESVATASAISVRDTHPEVQDVDFRRTPAGAGRVTIELGAADISPVVRAEGAGLTVEFPGTVLPTQLRRKLDVVDFGTPVQSVLTNWADGTSRLVLQMQGEWEHVSFQDGRQFVLEVSPRREEPTGLAQGPDFTGERMSLNFQNIDVRALLQVIADFTGFNIVTSDTVQGALTLRLKDVPWDQALNVIMEAKGLGMKRNGNVLWIAPKDEIDERARKELEAARALEKLEPLFTQSFQVNYAKAETLAKQLNDTGRGNDINRAHTRFLSERGTALAEPRTNQLFVTDTAAKLEDVRLLLQKLDVPVRQVMIEARIVEAKDGFSRALGMKLSTPRTIKGDVSTGQWRMNPFFNLPGGPDKGSASGFEMTILGSSTAPLLQLELLAMETENVGRIISNPRLMTADQTTAHIQQGTQIPYRTSDGDGGTPTTEFKDAVLRLQVSPQITPDGNIILDLLVNKDSPGERTDDGLAIDTKEVKTQVLVENGGTVVIGGIFESSEVNSVNKVPLLGDIPVVGNLFKNRTRETSKTEMLVFITPRMVTDAISNAQ